MYPHKSGVIGLLIVLFVSVLISSAHIGSGKIRFFQLPTILLQPDTVHTYLIDLEDDISNDTLFQTVSKEGYPISYFRKIKTGVCFDNECRLLDIVLYWNPTGRYLGFEIPEGEFLSKFDHEPFITGEYERLNELLADSLSPLGAFTYNELAPKTDPENTEVDGISSATSKDVLEYVVEGAAYTTYRLWHLVYGPTQEEVIGLTRKSLSPGLLVKVLESPDFSDRIWAINHIRDYVALTPELRDSILDFLDDRDYSMAERALHAIDPTELKSGSLQLLLLERFYKVDFSLKKLIIDKLKEAPILDIQVRKDLTHSLKSLKGSMLVNVLDLFDKHKVSDIETGRIVSELLQNENNFIAKKAFVFLENMKIEDEVIEDHLKIYKSEHGLLQKDTLP